MQRQYLSEPDGRACAEELGEGGGAGSRVSHRLGGNQPGEDWQPGLPTRHKLAEHGISCDGHTAQ